jgi:hypothetical protein
MQKSSIIPHAKFLMGSESHDGHMVTMYVVINKKQIDVLKNMKDHKGNNYCVETPPLILLRNDFCTSLVILSKSLF